MTQFRADELSAKHFPVLVRSLVVLSESSTWINKHILHIAREQICVMSTCCNLVHNAVYREILTGMLLLVIAGMSLKTR